MNNRISKISKKYGIILSTKEVASDKKLEANITGGEKKSSQPVPVKEEEPEEEWEDEEDTE